MAAAEPRCWRPTRPGTTPRAGCCRRCSAPGRCASCGTAGSPTPTRWSTRCCPRARSSTASERLADAFPLRVFPDAVGLGPDGRENLLPYGDHAFNAFGPANDLVAKGEPRVAELSAWVGAQCRRDALAPEGFGADIWAAVGPRGHHPRAGAARRPLAAHRRGRHDGARHLRRPLRLRDQPRPVAAAARRTRRWPGSPSTRRCAGSRRCRRSSGRRPPTSGWASTSSPRGTRSSCSWRRPTATRGAGRTRTRFDLSRDPSGPRRLRHGHPPVRRPARRPAGGRGAADRAGPAGAHDRAGRARRGGTTTTRCGPGRASRCG